VSDRLLDAAELAERLNVPKNWPLEQARAGNIPHLRLGRYVRFEWSAIEEWKAELRSGGRPAFRRHRPIGRVPG